MSNTAWWQNGVIYQIYTRSYQDDNGHGVGDLARITRPSPNEDCLILLKI